MSLYTLTTKRSCIIERLPGIALLRSLGLREGIKVNIMSKQPLGGPVVIQIANRSFAIAKDVAEQIEVREEN